MNNENWTLLALLGLFCILGILFVAITILSGYFASALGFDGMAWWCVTILFFIVISCLIGMINRIGA